MRRAPRMLPLALVLGLLLAAAGCVKMGPDYSRPNFEFKVPQGYQQAGKGAGPALPADRWWEDFADRRLNRIVRQTLQRNLQLQASSAQVRQLLAAFVQTRAERFPSVSLAGQGIKQRTSSSSSAINVPGLGGESEYYKLSLAASFEVDLWGKLARAEEAARADLLRAEENRRTVAQTVVASATTYYFQARYLQRRLQVTAASIKAFEYSLTVVEGRYRRGLVSPLNVYQARRALRSARALVPALQQELGKTQQALAVLLGRYPQTEAWGAPDEQYLKRVLPVPPGLPSELLLRRPDLRAAEANLQALSARIGVARAARFPTIKLTADWGYASRGLNSLFTPTSELWSLAAGISQPLFDAGKLAAGEEAARARYSQGVADYANTVLTAFSEVEGALLTRQKQLERYQRLELALKSAVAAQEAAQRRYLRGLEDYLNVLDAQRSRYTIEDDLVLTEQAIVTNRITLHRALGGGWASPPPLARAETN